MYTHIYIYIYWKQIGNCIFTIFSRGKITTSDSQHKISTLVNLIKDDTRK